MIEQHTSLLKQDIQPNSITRNRFYTGVPLCANPKGYFMLNDTRLNEKNKRPWQERCLTF